MTKLRVGSVLIEPRGRGKVVHVLRNGTTLQVSRKVLDLMDAFGDGAAVDDVLDSFPAGEHDRVRAVADKLVSAGVLTECAPSGDTGPDVFEQRWGVAARHFHNATRDAKFIPPRTDRAKAHVSGLATDERPADFKEYPDAPVLHLPRTLRRLDVSLAAVLEGRRTHRVFRQEPIEVEDLATVLHYTFAPLRFVQTESWGVLRLKASASGGARHEAEAYVAVLNVRGVPVGLYHYNTDRHLLEKLGELSGDDIDELTFRQGFGGGGAFTVFVTAVAGRLSHKYRHPRAYRILGTNVGHLGQTFAMVCTGLGLGAFTTVAFKDSELERILGIDGVNEFATYVIGAGWPVLRDDGMPARNYVPPELGPGMQGSKEYP